MAGRIEPQPWMADPATRQVMQALADGGAAARFVGGCVRDAVLGRPVRDIDIATEQPPDRVTAILEAAGLKVVPTGLAHGTVTAVVEHRGFEITTLRLDVETFGRHARVAFTDDWTADAARRDFTFNAMSLEVDGTLHDPFGGVADLQARRVRFVGDAGQRIAEDVLRLLRYFRFHAHYGAPPPDAAALAACRAMAPRLPTLSAERVSAELMKLLAAPDPAPVLRLMRAEGVLPWVLDEARDLARLERMTRIDADADPLRRLAAVLAVDAAGARAVAQRLRLSNRARDRLVRMAAGGGPEPGDDAAAQRRMLYASGPETYRDCVLMGWASAPSSASGEEGWPALLRVADGWTPPRFPLQGGDVTALGIAPGPRVGELLQAVEAWWIAADFKPDRAACLARLRALAAAG